MNIRRASFALRVVRRRGGDAAILYRRRLIYNGKERLDRVAAISPLAYSASQSMLRSAIRTNSGPAAKLEYGPFHALDEDWGARVAAFALISRGLRNADRLHRAASHLQHADGTEAAWWLGLMEKSGGLRAVRALRIMSEAVK